MTALVRLLGVGLAALMLSGSAAAARVPAGVRSIRIHSATGVTTSVAFPGDVREIVKWFDSLPRFVARPCPYPVYMPPDVSFDFRAAGGGFALHAVDHAPGTCSGSITYSNDGQVRYAPLAEGSFVARVSKLIGVDIDPSARTAANRRLAKRDAAHLLRLAVLPPGSHRVTTLIQSSGRLEHCSSDPVTMSVDAYVCRIWKVRMSFHTVIAFERAHRPDGSKFTFAGKELWRAHGPSSPLHVAEHLTFSFPAFRHRVSTRELTVNIVKLAHGWMGISINADETWVAVRAPDEVVPPAVRTIVVRVRSEGPAGPHGPVGGPAGRARYRRVTDPAEVAKIVRWFDALPLVQFGACDNGVAGSIPDTLERIAFLAGSGQVLARAKGYSPPVVSGACTPIEFAVGGHSFPPLLGGRFLIRVARLLR